MPEIFLSKYFKLANSHTLDAYLSHGGYGAARKVFDLMKPADVIDEVKKSNLRGLGGAGFPTGLKWSFIPKDSPKPVYLVVNADESEPGTFKDKYIMTYDPHQLLEGMIIASYAVGAHKAFIYIRKEYDLPFRRLIGAVQEAYAQGYLGKDIMQLGFDLDVVVHRGAGAYICGEETGLLESLEGKKGFPRLKPPFPATVGLFGCPTVINNVETIACVSHIISKGGAWFAGLGSEKNGGNRLYSISGHVEGPGVYELPNGSTLRSMIYDHAGGIRDGKRLKAVIPGGISASILAANEIDVKMDVESLRAAGTMIGSAGVIVMDETTCMVKALLSASHFFAHESCGQCSPCREGTGWVEKIVRRIVAGNGQQKDLDTLLSIARNMTGTTICALGDAAAMPVTSYIQKFRSEFDYHIEHGRCNLERVGNTGT
jgi:NADH-quinone oxidoreductase subunit F